MNHFRFSKRVTTGVGAHARSVGVVVLFASLIVPFVGPSKAVSAVEPVQVDWLLFNDPPIQTPVPPEKRTSGNSIAPIWDPDGFSQLDSANKNRVVNSMLDHVRDQELYNTEAGLLAEVLPAGFVEPLMEAAKAQAPRSLERRRAISALLHSPTKDKAAEIWDLSKDDPMLRPTVEDKLMMWKVDVAVADWRAVIADLNSIVPHVVAAAQGLGEVGDASDVEGLRTWLRPNQQTQIRVAVAGALSKLASDQNLAAAQSAWQPGGSAEQALIAANLLRNDKSIDAAKLLALIIRGNLDGADEVAFDMMLKNQPRAAAKLSFETVENGNSNVRRQSIELLGLSTNKDNVLALFGALNDGIPDNRSLALKMLLKAADDPKWQSVMPKAFVQKLLDEDWRTVEQAILGAVALKTKAAVPTFMKLTEHPVPSVNVTAAWGVKELAEDAKVFDWASKKVFDRFVESQREYPNPPGQYTFEEQQLHAQLVEILGKNRHQPSGEKLIQFASRLNTCGPLLRSCGIWALGKVREENPTDEMKGAIRKVMASMETRDPDDPLAAFAAILTSGRFRDTESVSMWMDFRGGEIGRVDVGQAADWALSLQPDGAAVATR